MQLEIVNDLIYDLSTSRHHFNCM